MALTYCNQKATYEEFYHLKCLYPLPCTHSQIPSNSTPSLEALGAAPTLLWWVPREHIGFALDAIAYAGLGLSAILVVLGAGNAVIFVTLWALYHSLVNVGQRW